MVDLLVSASTGVLGSLLAKLASMLNDKCKALGVVCGDIEALKVELEFMQAFLQTMANVEEPNEQDKLRVRDVRELSYDIEDSIDKFMLHVGSEPDTKNQGFFKMITDMCKNLVIDIKTRHQITKEVKDILNKVVETSQRYNRYKIDEAFHNQRNAVVDSRVVAIFKDASELVGIDGPRDDLINLIKHEKYEVTRQLKVLSVFGSGGVGKTTLASQVYSNLGANFGCRAFVSISRNPDVTKILSSILSEISNHTTAAGGTPEIIIKDIREFLEDKRFFIVVDDIWAVQPIWDILKCAFGKNNCGSWIMITTRIMDVAISCSSHDEDLVYQMKPLSDVDSKRLFFKRIFDSEKCPTNLELAANEILKKCGGLPLAIIAISSLLATRQTDDQWDRLRRSNGFAFGNSVEVDGMRGILSLSYFELPHYLKSCLLYLALFPEDYEIDRRRLVHRWIAEGFIYGEVGQDLVELGGIYFHELVNRSLVQPLEIGYDGKAEKCRVHDTILDFLIHKATEENFCTLSSNRPHLQDDAKIRRLSLLENDSKAHVKTSLELNTSHLRSLGVFRWSIEQEILSVVDLSYLRVLDLKGCWGIEGFVKTILIKLHHLRYLNVAETDIRGLPAHIGDLKHLETLDATRTYLAQLPETITRLKQLARLFVPDDTALPDGIGNLKKLQELGNIDFSRCSLKSLQGLGELSNLTDLTIQCDTTSKIKGGDKACHEEKLTSSLRKLEACSLRNLVLRLNDGDTFLPALDSIRSVTLLNPQKCKITRWLVSLANLQYLDVTVGVIEQQDFELIGSIPTLLYFRLNTYYCTSHREGTPLVVRQGFQCLQKFCFVSQYGGFSVQPGAMLKLKDLELCIVAVNFKACVGGFDFGIQHLFCLARISLQISGFYASDEDMEALKGAFTRMVEAHPNRPTLEVVTW